MKGEPITLMDLYSICPSYEFDCTKQNCTCFNEWLQMQENRLKGG